MNNRCCRLTTDPPPPCGCGRKGQLSTRYGYMHVQQTEIQIQIQIQFRPSETSRRSEFVKYVTNIFNLAAILAVPPFNHRISSIPAAIICSTIYNSIVLISFLSLGCSKKWSSIESTVSKVKCLATIFQLVRFHPFTCFLFCCMFLVQIDLCSMSVQWFFRTLAAPIGERSFYCLANHILWSWRL